MGMAGAFLDGLDHISQATVGHFRPKGVVISILVHSVFLDAEEAESTHIQAQQSITVADLDACIKEFLRIGFSFIAPDASDDQLSDSGQYVWLTFDDGYWNNLRALPLLERYKIPATFYVASGFVKSGRGFWQDTLQREMLSRGATAEAVREAKADLRSRRSIEVQRALVERFGADCLTPKDDIARPLTPTELKALARSPWARIGNHTRDHEILANRSLEEAQFQIQACQEDLTGILGKAPNVFAYPNGLTLEGAGEVLQSLGLKLALTTAAGKNPVKSLQDVRSRYLLKRYLLWGKRDIASQVRSFASAVRPSDVARTFRDRVFQPRGY
jgi:peptidoglycan/xylan/chitin deacetylase (PgdA/CDA1 family)